QTVFRGEYAYDVRRFQTFEIIQAPAASCGKLPAANYRRQFVGRQRQKLPALPESSSPVPVP
ncbi:MAG: hypothetical protein LBT29_05230, partial [Flavobacteriaceae bacterium]|nr:hypothetical protein [Flavobacteriaceae bacterium]